jgi:hypothetical protein
MAQGAIHRSFSQAQILEIATQFSIIRGLNSMPTPTARNAGFVSQWNVWPSLYSDKCLSKLNSGRRTRCSLAYGLRSAGCNARCTPFARWGVEGAVSRATHDGAERTQLLPDCGPRWLLVPQRYDCVRSTCLRHPLGRPTGSEQAFMAALTVLPCATVHPSARRPTPA